jgi:hypothetical protein
MHVGTSKIYCHIWLECVIRELHIMLLSIYEICENLRRESHNFLMGINAIKLAHALCKQGAWIAQSVQRLATGWTVRGSNPGGGGGGDFLHTSRLDLGPIQPPLKWVPLLSRG